MPIFVKLNSHLNQKQFCLPFVATTETLVFQIWKKEKNLLQLLAHKGHAINETLHSSCSNSKLA